MNVCHEGGSIVAFPDPWRPGGEPEPSAGPSGADWLEYCRVRLFAERAAAKRARSTEARRVHQELAQAYALIVQQGLVR